MIPAWVWIPIVICGSALTAVITWRLVKANLTAKWGRHEISLMTGGSDPADGCDDEHTHIFRKLERILTIMHDEMANLLLNHMAHDLKIPKDSLSNNIDFAYACTLIWMAVYGVNGRHSVRTIVGDYIKYNDYKIDTQAPPEVQVDRRREIMRDMTSQINAEVQKIFEDKYDNLMTYYNLETGERINIRRAITRERIAEILRVYTVDNMATLIESIFLEEWK